MENDINWWEGNPNSIVLLKESFLDSIDTSKHASESTGIAIRTLQRWRVEDRHPTLKDLIRYADAMKIKRQDLNREIIGLTSFKRKGVWKAGFPFKEDPSHIGIIAHGFFDGNECCGLLVYGTLTKEENDDFVRLVNESGFGAYLVKYSRDRKGLPSSVTQLLKNHYGIKTFLSDRCVFSDKVMAMALAERKCLNEILRAAFLDEGHVTLKNGICAFGIKNDRLNVQLCHLLTAAGYEYWSADTPSETQVYLRFSSCRRFYDEILSDLPDSYRKKIRIRELLSRFESTALRRKNASEIQGRLLQFINSRGNICFADIYAHFGIEQRDKKMFYNRHIRQLKNMHLIVITKQGDVMGARPRKWNARHQQ